MNLPWIETLRPGNIQDCGCHVSEGGWVPDRAVAGSPQKPFDNYGQNENEMAYCGEACCAVPGRENWGAVSAANGALSASTPLKPRCQECCHEHNIGAEWRAPNDGVEDASGDVIWRRCTPACEANPQCKEDAQNPDIGWGTCADDSCNSSGQCGFNSGKIWAFNDYVRPGHHREGHGLVQQVQEHIRCVQVTQPGAGANGRNGKRNQCRCCQGREYTARPLGFVAALC